MPAACFIKQRWRAAVTAACLLLLIACNTAWAKDGADPFPGFAASSYLLKVQEKVLWARDPDRALPPASLTKIMTALLAIKHTRLDDVVVVSKTAARETGTRLGLKAGERMYAGHLLAATLLQSANDACRALADHVAGSETTFVGMMNREAVSLGMTHTHFANACGHDDPGLYSSARDLAVLAEAALKEKIFADLVETVYLDISTVGGARTFRLENKNEFLGRYPGVIGVKTGFTPKAGKCVIALVERGGVRVLLVVLNAPDRWWGGEKVLDAAFARVAQTKKVSRP
jgi:serine-type D-Ala-D-Ala carboxypeptidase (penicillin-binding protein 5/6)